MGGGIPDRRRSMMRAMQRRRRGFTSKQGGLGQLVGGIGASEQL